MLTPLHKRQHVAIGALLALVCSFLSLFSSPAGAQSRCAGDPLVEWSNRSITSGRGLGGVLNAVPLTGDLSSPAAAGTYTVRTLSQDSGAGRATAVAETDESWTAVFLGESGNEVGRTPFTRDIADGVASAESADTFTVRLTGEATSVRVDHKILDANSPANSVSPVCIGLTAASGSSASGGAGSGATGSGAAGSGSGAAASPKAPCATNPAIPFDSTSCGNAAGGSGAAGSGAAGSGAAGNGSGAAGGAAADSTGGKPPCLTNPAIPADSTSCNPNGPKAPCATNSAIPFDSTSCADASVLGETVDAPAGGATGGAAGDGSGAGAGAAGSGTGGAAGADAGDTSGSPTVDGELAFTGASTIVALTLVLGCLLVAGGIAAMNAASRKEIYG